MSFMALGAVELISSICEKTVIIGYYVAHCRKIYKNVKDRIFLAAKKCTVFFSTRFIGKWYKERYP